MSLNEIRNWVKNYVGSRALVAVECKVGKVGCTLVLSTQGEPGGCLPAEAELGI